MFFSKFFKQSGNPDASSLPVPRTKWQDEKLDCITPYDRDFHKFATSRDSANCRKKNFFGLSEEYEMTEYMGGKIEELILRLKGKEFICIGRSDGHHETVGSWFGYEHGSGLPDRNGKKWWIYQKCTKSDYDIAWWKVVRLQKRHDSLIFDNEGSTDHSTSKFQSQTLNSASSQNGEYYRILAVSYSATIEEIKQTYRFLVRRFHPDGVCDQKESATEILKKINEAYEILSDPAKRKEYDRRIGGS